MLRQTGSGSGGRGGGLPVCVQAPHNHKGGGGGQICGSLDADPPPATRPPPPPPLLEAFVRHIILQMHTPARSSQCWCRQTPAWTRSVHLDAPGQWHGQQPISGTADPRCSQTGQVIQGLR